MPILTPPLPKHVFSRVSYKYANVAREVATPPEFVINSPADEMRERMSRVDNGIIQVAKRGAISNEAKYIAVPCIAEMLVSLEIYSRSYAQLNRTEFIRKPIERGGRECFC